MSFVKQPIHLPNTPAGNKRLKLCDKCGLAQEPEGGVDMSPTRWYCASCWVVRQTGFKKK